MIETRLSSSTTSVSSCQKRHRMSLTGLQLPCSQEVITQYSVVFLNIMRYSYVFTILLLRCVQTLLSLQRSHEFSKGGVSGPLLQSTPIGGGAGDPVASSAAASSIATSSSPSVAAAMKTERSKEGDIDSSTDVVFLVN